MELELSLRLIIASIIPHAHLQAQGGLWDRLPSFPTHAPQLPSIEPTVTAVPKDDVRALQNVAGSYRGHLRPRSALFQPSFSPLSRAPRSILPSAITSPSTSTTGTRQS